MAEAPVLANALVLTEASVTNRISRIMLKLWPIEPRSVLSLLKWNVTHLFELVADLLRLLLVVVVTTVRHSPLLRHIGVAVVRRGEGAINQDGRQKTPQYAGGFPRRRREAN